jgi:hypothetical protein
MAKIYAVYRGENLIFDGTSKECMEFLGVSRSQLGWLCSPSHHKKIERKTDIKTKGALCVVKLGDDE